MKYHRALYINIYLLEEKCNTAIPTPTIAITTPTPTKTKIIGPIFPALKNQLYLLLPNLLLVYRLIALLFHYLIARMTIVAIVYIEINALCIYIYRWVTIQKIFQRRPYPLFHFFFSLLFNHLSECWHCYHWFIGNCFIMTESRWCILKWLINELSSSL